MMDFIDTHHHLLNLDIHNYKWFKKGVVKNYLINDFIKDAEGIGLKKSIHIQAEIDHSANPVIETKWLKKIADHPESKGFPQAIVAYADLTDCNIDSILEKHFESSNLRGIRQILNFSFDNPKYNMAERGDFMLDKDWRKGLSKLEAYNLSFDLQICPWQMNEACNMISAFPNLLFILNLTGCPFIQEGRKYLKQWEKGMNLLSEHENIVVKISGLFKPGDYSDELIREIVLKTIDIFNIDRCMFGSNFPLDSVRKNYKETWEFFNQITLDFSENERKKMFVANAEKYYRI